MEVGEGKRGKRKGKRRAGKGRREGRAKQKPQNQLIPQKLKPAFCCHLTYNRKEVTKCPSS